MPLRWQPSINAATFFVRPILVGADVNNEVRIRAGFPRQPRGQLPKAHALFVEHINTRRADFDGADVALINFFVRLAHAFWKFEVDALLQQGRGDDEDDEQHEREVEQAA